MAMTTVAEKWVDDLNRRDKKAAQKKKDSAPSEAE